MVLGKLNSRMQRNEIGPLSSTIHKNELKTDERFECEDQNCKTPRRKRR